MTAAADVTSAAPPPPQRAAKHRNQHRGKHGKQQRGVRIFTNAVPHGQPNLPRKSSSGETDDDVAQRPDEPLDARASEFHPVKNIPLNLASCRDAARTVDEAAPPPATETPTGPLSHAAAESSRESSVVLTSNQSETGSEIATAENNARDEKEAAWPRLDASAPVVPSKRASIAVAGTKGATVVAVRVRDDDGGWRCDECHAHNRDARADCRRCGVDKVLAKKVLATKTKTFSSSQPGPPPPPPPGPPPPLTIIRAALAGGRDDADIPCSPCAPSELHPPKPPTPRTSSPSPPSPPQQTLEKQGSLLRTLLPNLPSDDWAEMVGENDLPALPQSFHDASEAFADVEADVEADMDADLEADVADVSTHGGGDFGGDFGEGFEAPVDVAPPPGFQDSNAEHTPATDASAIALAALQAALHADRAAHSQAARAMSAASADTHAMKRAEAKIHAVETKIHAAMDERLALLERCFADRIENLRKAVETGDAEREVLRGRVETLEATLATKEGRRDASSGVPVYSCPPLDPGEYLGHPSSPPPAPRGTRPPPVVIDVEDVLCPPSKPSHQPSHQPLHAPEGVQGARDDDVDEMREDEDTETPTETTEEAGAEESFYLSADGDAEEFEVTLAGFRSEPAKVVTATPAALAKNPFEGLMDKDGDEADEAEDVEEEEEVAKVVVKRREGTSPTSPLSPPKHRGSAASSSRETSLDEETVEEALAAIAREEDEARKRRTKKSRKKGSGGKKSAAEKREAKVAAYLQKKVEAKNEIATDAKKKKNRGVSWADEAPVTVPTTAVTGERIRMLHSARATGALRTRLQAVLGPDTVA
jgi:hypothetical protein